MRFASKADLRAIVAEHVRTYAAAPQDRPHQAQVIESLTDWLWHERGIRSERDISWSALNTRMTDLFNAIGGN